MIPVQGDRLVVAGITYATARVERTEFICGEDRYKIYLDWGIHGKSHVFDTDENDSWYRYNVTN